MVIFLASLQVDPKKRITVPELLQDDWITNGKELERVTSESSLVRFFLCLYSVYNVCKLVLYNDRKSPPLNTWLTFSIISLEK